MPNLYTSIQLMAHMNPHPTNWGTRTPEVYFSHLSYMFYFIIPIVHAFVNQFVPNDLHHFSILIRDLRKNT